MAALLRKEPAVGGRDIDCHMLIKAEISLKPISVRELQAGEALVNSPAKARET